jgi:mono/diheme cytochrome c family protein
LATDQRSLGFERVFGPLAVLTLVAAGAAACRQDMHDQPRYTPLQSSSFFPDGSASRPLPAGTVARGQLKDDVAFYTGKAGDEDVTEIPVPVDEARLRRGREMYDAHCAHCHGLTGAGDGMVVQRGFSKPPPLSEERLRDAPIGHVFDVVTNGFGAMPDHAAQIKVMDRWAIAAYVRALQVAGSGSVDAVPSADRERLERAGAAPNPAPGAASGGATSDNPAR